MTTQFDSDGSIKLAWQPVSGAKSYVIHYGNANVTDAKQLTFMGYTETNSFTLPASDVPANTPGDKLTFAVQTFAKTGEGADNIAKAEYLNTKASGSAWGNLTAVVTKPTDANTVDQIKAWLDTNKIDYTGKTAKADLLALVK